MKYTFKKEAECRIMNGGSKLCNIYEDFSKYVLVFGQLKTLFGEPLYVTENLEEQYSYSISATDETGSIFFLDAYSGPTGPAICGLSEAREAAEALAAYIRAAEVSDYDYEGYYLDAPCKVRMGVKNGQPYEEESELTDQEAAELFQKLF